ncbi:MAG: cell division protein ZapA [Candidatus Cloacimonetes bacterium]|jgi:cell division protein ZapA (FtsZ GTPase activity inhibitor)|nr:cell division protein ZapA [Candidatus Cloacimonadota bacterium]MBT6993414.1 cell division protein ZapA [Candidatus Cloacimonadota bacterium]MBT7470078.1 cell division protein ZapA [Candidatus Cloacimonadota bacterium]
MNSVEIEILGKKYFFKTENPEKLKKTATYLKEQLEKMNEKYNTVDQHKLFVLYALRLTEQYFENENVNEKLTVELDNIAKLMVDVEIK